MSIPKETFTNELVKAFYHSPVGKLTLLASSKGLRAILWPDKTTADQVAAIEMGRDNRHLVEARKELDCYFMGKLKRFTVNLDPMGTPFQKQVWQALSAIPSGETRSYSEIASIINRPQAQRAVGTANGSNPLPIVVPCHRVITKAGTLGGFAAGSRVKQQLLALEMW